MIRSLLVLAAMLGCTLATVRARTINVPDEYSRIQDAIAASADGDVVLVQPGTYVETLDFLGKAITVTGTVPEDSVVVAGTVVDANAAGSVVSFANGENRTVSLIGFTLRGGSGSPRSGVAGDGSLAGGGVFCSGSVSPRIARCAIVGNAVSSPDAQGGGVHCEAGATPRIEHCRIDSNGVDGSSARGAGLSCVAASPNVVDCLVRGNEAAGASGYSTGGRGGGLACGRNANPVLRRCVISHNAVSGDFRSLGAGVYCRGIASPRLVDCTIARNTTGSMNGKGGGVHAASSASPVLVRCTIERNWASKGAGVYTERDARPALVDCGIVENAGHGIECFRSSPTLRGCTIVGNGIAVYCDYRASPRVTHCTIVGNRPDRPGGALSVYNECHPIVEGSILWGNYSAPIAIEHESSTVAVNWSDVQGGWPGEGNIDLDPALCQVDCRPHDLALSEVSPCVGAGKDGSDMGSQPVGCEEPLRHEPRTVTVPGEYVDIAGAIDAACEGDTVLVEPGTYLEHDLTIRMGITVCSLDPGNHEVVASTVVHGSGRTSVFSFAPSDRVPLLTGFTITGAQRGVSCSYSAPVVRRCVIRGNSGWGWRDGGVHCSMSSPQIDECAIVGNYTQSWSEASGAGIACRGDATSRPRITGCEIAWNTVHGLSWDYDYHGGGIYCYGAAPHIENTRIHDNRVIGDLDRIYGGGVALVRAAEPAALENCVIDGNRLEIVDVYLEVHGGGVYCERGDVSIVNCTFSDNRSEAPDGRGGALYLDNGTDAEVRNCVLWGNAPDEIAIGEGEGSVAFSTIQGGYPGEGNIDANPLFRSYGGWEYLLAARSPCIDTGDPAIEDGISDWHPKWPAGYRNGARSDMGAYGGPSNRGWLQIE
ncbi:MAG: hypothetical protein CME06_04865 [Gemmatimonadetes bacterium]|nr:hypothetical protein [Gemmatimonadota bacterium]